MCHYAQQSPFIFLWEIYGPASLKILIPSHLSFILVLYSALLLLTLPCQWPSFLPILTFFPLTKWNSKSLNNTLKKILSTYFLFLPNKPCLLKYPQVLEIQCYKTFPFSFFNYFNLTLTSPTLQKLFIINFWLITFKLSWFFKFDFIGTCK